MARGRSTLTTAATAALDRGGVTYTLHPYDHDTRAVAAGGSYGLEAAAALGVEPARVFKTLLAEVDTAGPRSGPGLAVAVVPVDRLLDLKALAIAFGGKRATMADPHEAERATGYVVGGISPLGQRRALPTVIDSSAAAWPTIFVSAGRRGVDLEIAPGELVRVTGGRLAALTPGERPAGLTPGDPPDGAN